MGGMAAARVARARLGRGNACARRHGARPMAFGGPLGAPPPAAAAPEEPFAGDDDGAAAPGPAPAAAPPAAVAADVDVQSAAEQAAQARLQALAARAREVALAKAEQLHRANKASKPLSPPKVAAMKGEDDKGLAMKGESDGVGVSQVRLYEQMTRLRKTMNVRISEVNKYARYLEREMESRDEALEKSHERITMTAVEATNLQRAVRAAVSNAKSAGADPDAIADQLVKLELDLEEFTRRVREHARQAELLCVRSVPVSWYGMAQDVRVMGTFDGWSRGVHLSPEVTGAATNFTADLLLMPGTYEIKFVVDGEWQVAADWDTCVGEDGATNNVIVVE